MRTLFVLAYIAIFLLLSACASSQQTADNKEVELLRKENELSKKEAELAKKELELSQSNTANTDTSDTQQPQATSPFDFSSVKGKTLNQIFTPSGLNEIEQLISADSKKRLVRVKDKVLKEMKNGQGGWNGGTELWFEESPIGESLEGGWHAQMKQGYNQIELERNFTVSKDGITFRHDISIGFPRSVRELEPSAKFFYSWTVLKPYLVQ